MKLSVKLKKYRRILAVVVILLLVAGIELGFNYPAIKQGYDWIDISSDMRVEKLKKKQYHVISFESPEGCYIKQLRIKGQFEERQPYYIEAVEKNAFGKLEEHTYEDTVSPWFPETSINLGTTVVSMKIRVPVKSLSDIPGAEISNSFEINKYRILFFLAVLVLLYCILFEPFFRKRVEWYFVLYAVFFGSLMLVYIQPQVSCWDEKIHFNTTYRIASGRVIEWNEAAEAVSAGVSPKCNTKAEYAWLRSVMNEKGKNATAVEIQQGPLVTFSQLSYIPSALFLKVGILLRLPFTVQFMLGKMGNLLTYIFVMFWAIRLARRRKLFLAFISMMPTSIFIASSYTYDCAVFCFITLAGVLWANEVFAEKGQRRRWAAILPLGLFVVGCSAKIIYMPLALILILMPQLKVKNRKVRIALGVSVLSVCVVVMLTFLGPLLLDMMNGTLNFGDVRGGETSMAGQLSSMQQNIGYSIRMLFEQIFRFDNFRNSGKAATDNFLMGNLLFLNYHNLGVMADKWCMLLFPAVTVLLLYRDSETEDGRGNHLLPKRRTVFVGSILMLVVLLIWLSMYLAFTPVGEDQILGVQARYYLPLLYLASLLIQNKKVFIQIQRETITYVCLLSVFILEAVSVFDFLLKNRLF